MLQRAALVNSVLCREAMLLGRIMEEEEAARVKKKKKNTRLKGGEAGNLCNRLFCLLACSFSLSLF